MKRRISTTRRAHRGLAALVAAVGLLAAACGDDDDDAASATAATEAPAGESTDDPAPATDAPATAATDAPATAATDAPAPATDAPATDQPTIRVRGQDFSESVTIAEVYGQYLSAKGYDVEILTPAGFRTEAIDGLTNGDLDLIIDYIGGALTALAPDAPSSSDPDEIAATIGPAFQEIGATLLDHSPAVDGDAFVVRGDLDATKISDVAGMDLVFGASAACFERPQCFVGYTDPAVYGIEFADTVTIEFGPLLGEALTSGDVDAVVWNSTAPQIALEGFKVLEDDKGLHPAQNIAPIISTEVLEAYGDQLAADLNELSAAITTDDLVAWNVETDVNFRESDDVAAEWLASKGLI
jgi:osmoprotectant transport system substrate-binding protein